MVKIIPKRADPFIVNEHHILHLRFPQRRKKGLAFDINMTVKDYIEQTSEDFKRRHKLKLQGVDFNISESLPIDPYILGTWLGDGHSHTTMLTNMDEEVISEWKNYGEKMGLNCVIKDTNSKAKNILLTSGKNGGQPTSNKFKKALLDLNLINNKHIPNVYLKASREDRLQLLAGLLDTDGTLGSNGRLS